MPVRANVPRLPDPRQARRAVSRCATGRASTARSYAARCTTPNWNHYREIDELPQLLRAETEQFFAIYRDFQPGKPVSSTVGIPAKRRSKIVVSQKRFSD